MTPGFVTIPVQHRMKVRPLPFRQERILFSSVLVELLDGSSSFAFSRKCSFPFFRPSQFHLSREMMFRTSSSFSLFASRAALVSLVSSSTPRCYSGVDKIAEDKIVRWLKEGGEKDLRRHRDRLKSDPHLHLARSMNLQDDFVHSKILADNRILPKSIELRQKLDKEWEKLKVEILAAWESAGKPDLQTFMHMNQLQPLRDRMKDLDSMAKQVNNAIIEDSMLFRGRSPVRHAKNFVFEDRVREALDVRRQL